MRLSIWLFVWTAGCGSLTGSDESEPTAVEKPAGAVPQKEALAFYCDFMYRFNPADLRDVAAEDRQPLMATRMEEAAEKDDITGWATFHTNLKARFPDDRQKWLEHGVQEHGLQSECIAARPRNALTPDEQQQVREHRVKLMKEAASLAPAKDGEN